MSRPSVRSGIAKSWSSRPRVDGCDGRTIVANLIAPSVANGQAVLGEIIEQGEHYLWLRLLVYDPRWPRIIEVRADSLGTLAVQAHVQEFEARDVRRLGKSSIAKRANSKAVVLPIHRASMAKSENVESVDHFT